MIRRITVKCERWRATTPPTKVTAAAVLQAGRPIRLEAASDNISVVSRSTLGLRGNISG